MPFVPMSSGDVDGPASSTDGAIALQSGTTGKLLKNAPSLYDSDNNLNLLAALYGDKYKLEVKPLTATLSLSNDDIGKFLIYAGTTVLNLPTGLAQGAKFYVLNSSNSTMVLTPTGGALLDGNNTLYYGDIYELMYSSPTQEYIVTNSYSLYNTVIPSTAGVGAPLALTSNNSKSIFTNQGATALAYFNLPQAATGLSYTFYVQDSDGIRIVANGTDTITIGSSTSAGGGFAENLNAGTCVTLQAINSSQWAAMTYAGTWTVT